MIRKLVRFFIGALFIPVAVATTRAFFLSLGDLSHYSRHLFIIAMCGFATYTVFHMVVMKPMGLYTWGHEVVHVLATWLSGGRVTSFSASSEGGKVTTTKENAFIRTAPYFVPIHTILLSLIYWALCMIFDMAQFLSVFVFLVGMTVSFHIFMTVEALRTKQPDVVKTGYVFSVLVIYVVNLFVVGLVLSMIFEDISFLVFCQETWVRLKEIYVTGFRLVYSRISG